MKPLKYIKFGKLKKKKYMNLIDFNSSLQQWAVKVSRDFESFGRYPASELWETTVRGEGYECAAAYSMKISAAIFLPDVGILVAV